MVETTTRRTGSLLKAGAVVVVSAVAVVWAVERWS
jgi:hypothetical protein